MKEQTISLWTNAYFYAYNIFIQKYKFYIYLYLDLIYIIENCLILLLFLF